MLYEILPRAKNVLWTISAEQNIYRFAVTVRPMPLYTRNTARSNIADLTKFLTGVNIGDVYLNSRYSDSLQCVGNGNARVGVGTGI